MESSDAPFTTHDAMVLLNIGTRPWGATLADVVGPDGVTLRYGELVTILARFTALGYITRRQRRWYATAKVATELGRLPTPDRPGDKHTLLEVRERLVARAGEEDDAVPTLLDLCITEEEFTRAVVQIKNRQAVAMTLSCSLLFLLVNAALFFVFFTVIQRDYRVALGGSVAVTVLLAYLFGRSPKASKHL